MTGGPSGHSAASSIAAAQVKARAAPSSGAEVGPVTPSTVERINSAGVLQYGRTINFNLSSTNIIQASPVARRAHPVARRRPRPVAKRRSATVDSSNIPTP